MSNMRGYSIPMYPETKRKLEIIKDEQGMTWDELFNYLMEIENVFLPTKSTKGEKEKRKRRKEGSNV